PPRSRRGPSNSSIRLSGLAARAGAACMPSRTSAITAVTIRARYAHLRCPFSAIRSMTIPRSTARPPVSPSGTVQANNILGGIRMLGLMQDWPLLCHRIIEHAAKYHGTQEVVTRSVEGPIVRTNYAEIHQRALKVSQMLQRDGIKLGDRVATIAWNTWRHLECWYGIMGIGAICHTINPRRFPEQIGWIINHAEDRVVMTDITFVPILEKIASQLPSVERFIVLTDKAHMPQTTLKNAIAYEEWLAQADGKFEWQGFGENTTAPLC